MKPGDLCIDIIHHVSDFMMHPEDLFVVFRTNFLRRKCRDAWNRKYHLLQIQAFDKSLLGRREFIQFTRSELRAEIMFGESLKQILDKDNDNEIINYYEYLESLQ